MKSICVNESSGFDQLDHVKSSRSVSAFVHVFVTVKSSSVTIVCKALVLSESFVSTSVLGLGIDSPTWKVCHTVKACVEVSSQDHVLFGSPNHEFLNFHQSCHEFSQFLPPACRNEGQLSIQLDRSPSCRTPDNLRLSCPFLIDDNSQASQSSQEFGRREQFVCTNVHSIQFSETFLQQQHPNL